MPIWLRRMIARELSDDIREHNKKVEEAQGKAKEWGSRDIKSMKDRVKNDTPNVKTPKPPYVTSKRR